MININKRKEQRFLFLHRLYELAGGSELKRIEISSVSNFLEIDRQEENNICQYLKGEGLAKPVNMSISITHFGIVEVEAALSEPDKPTQYFPPYNIINIQTMSHSVIQQGNVNSSQEVTIKEETINDINQFLSSLREKLPELALSSDGGKELNADITTIQAQIDSSKPKKSIVKECLFSIQRILEGVTGNIVAQELLTNMPALLALF